MFQKVFIAQGSGVTIEYIMKKGSACVESFREISHRLAIAFGDPDRARRHKEVRFNLDLQALAEDMKKNQIFEHLPGRFIAAEAKKSSKDKSDESAVVDIITKGSAVAGAKWVPFLHETTFDKALGYPVGATSEQDEGEAMGAVNEVSQEDIEMVGDMETVCPGFGGLGGGDEYTDGVEYSEAMAVADE